MLRCLSQSFEHLSEKYGSVRKFISSASKDLKKQLRLLSFRILSYYLVPLMFSLTVGHPIVIAHRIGLRGWAMRSSGVLGFASLQMQRFNHSLLCVFLS